MKKNITGIVMTILLNNGLNAQSHNLRLKEPEVGKPCPAFVFDKIDFYPKNKVGLSDFKGKWLVMIFWSKYCTGCIAAFPEESERQKRFKDNAQFLLVAGKSEKDERPMFSNYHNKLKLEIPSAYDSNLFKSFNVGQLPFTVIIDPDGIVRVITNAAHNSEIAELIEGKSPAFMNASYDHGHEETIRPKYNIYLPFLVQGNGGIDSNFLYRSLLSNWTQKTPIYRNNAMIHSEYENNVFNLKGKFEMIGSDATSLYSAAYTGKFNTADFILYGNFWTKTKPILEIKDSSLFKPNLVTGEKYYCYSLVVPPSKATEGYMMNIMQNDLKNYFGYEVSIELRKMPYWRLIVIDPAAKERLKTKGGKEERNEVKLFEKWSIKSMSTYGFANFVGWYSGVNDGSLVIDETGIEGSIDIIIEGLKNNYDSVRESLQKNGLDLVKGEKEMKCIVIRDPKN